MAKSLTPRRNKDNSIINFNDPLEINITETAKDFASMGLAAGFNRNPPYQEVHIDFDFVNSYKVWIGEGDYLDKQVGYKRMLSYPYENSPFHVGDYITAIYDNVQTTWLLREIDKQNPYNVLCRIHLTNNYFKWVDDMGVLRKYPCVIENKILESGRAVSKVPVIEGSITAYIQRNEYTNSIKFNQLLLFGGDANTEASTFQVYQIFPLVNSEELNENVLRVDLQRIDNNNVLNDSTTNTSDVYKYTWNKIEILQSNFEQAVGYTKQLEYTIFQQEEKVSLPVMWNSSNNSVATVSTTGLVTLIGVGSSIITCSLTDNENINDTVAVTCVGSLPSTTVTRIIPNNITVILQGEIETFTIYTYVDNVPNSDDFDITFSGPPNSGAYEDYYYKSTLITGSSFAECNKFSIKSIRQYSQSELKITAVNNITQEILEFTPIRLGGLL